MNKRKYRAELLRLRQDDRMGMERFAKLLEGMFELFVEQFKPIRPTMPIDMMPREQARSIVIEEFAQVLHEAGREAVEKKKTVVASLGLETPSKFLEWDEITEDAKEGRRIQARYLLERFYITEK